MLRVLKVALKVFETLDTRALLMETFQPTLLLLILNWSNFRKHDDMKIIALMVAFRVLKQKADQIT